MARRVFFSFHYQRDIWRINQIRNIGEIVGASAAGFHDASLWEEAKKKGDVAINAMIDEGLKNTSVTVVCIGPQLPAASTLTTKSTSRSLEVTDCSAFRFTS